METLPSFESRFPYVVLRAEDSQLEEILRLVHENFDKEETVIRSMRNSTILTEELEELIRLDHQRLLRAVFAHSPCLVAIHEPTGKIVGVNLTILSRNPRLDDSNGVSAVFENCVPKTDFVKRYFDCLSEIGEKARLYERFDQARAALEFYAIVVDKEHRRKGLSKLLTEEMISLARKMEDVDLVFGIYTSLYSKKAATSCGLKTCMDVDLKSYRNSEGTPIFQDTEPHNIVSVMVLQI